MIDLHHDIMFFIWVILSVVFFMFFQVRIELALPGGPDPVGRMHVCQATVMVTVWPPPLQLVQWPLEQWMGDLPFCDSLARDHTQLRGR